LERIEEFKKAMLIQSAVVRKEIKAVWSSQRFLVLSDTDWLLPEKDEVQNTIREVAVDRMPFVNRLFECEEFALMLVARVREHRAKLAMAGDLPKTQWRNWPLGCVGGTRFKGETVDHWINICLTKQGLFLIEPQTNEMWVPTESGDKIIFLFM
jgi:hypothetical protein